MAYQAKSAFLDDKRVGEVSAYSAMPAVECPSCGERLHRIFNTDTQWEYICVSEKLLVTPGKDDPPVRVKVE